MESKHLSFILIFGVLAGQTNVIEAATKFEKCMEPCLVACAIPPWTAPCAFRCLAICILQPNAKTTAESSHQFCTVGCATSKCSKLISKDNYRLDEVKDCVDGCSQACCKLGVHY